MSKAVDLSLEFTPNPNTLKYVVNQQLLSQGSAQFASQESAKSSPLAEKLFGINGVGSIMIGRNFITITKTEPAEWDKLHEACSHIIKDHLEKDEKIVNEEAQSVTHHGLAQNEIESQIIKILDEEIRPAVAMDGGDITFSEYKDGVVYLTLQGSCSGCPSSTMTLKMGIEMRLKELIPEIREVVSV